MKTRFMLQALIMAATLAVAAPSFAVEAIGVVGALQGSASAAGGNGARVLKVGDQVFLDEEVTTGAGSKLQLMLNDRSTITLNPNSKVKVKEFAFDANSDSGSMAMESVKGAFRFIGGALSKQNPVTIKTPVSSIGIRGGIADTHVADTTGATDAIFLFGDAMTMTNQNGQTVEVTTPGQGLTMNTPTDVPSFTPPNVVQQHLSSFDPAGSSTGDTGNGDTGAAATGGDTGGDTGAGDGTTGESSDGANATGSDGSTGEASAEDRSSYGSFADNSTSSTETRSSATESGRTDTVVAGNSINTVASSTTTGASTTDNAGSGRNVIQANNNNAPEFRGRYSVNDRRNSTRERGMIAVSRRNGEFNVNATEQSPNNGATHAGNLPIATTAGYAQLSTPFVLDPAEPTTTYTGFSSAMPGLNSFYYHLLDTNSGNPDIVNMFSGRQIPLSQLGAAMNNTAAIGHNGSGINYYEFLPDLLSYEGRTGTPLGFFDYGIRDINPVITGDSGRNITPFGMAVDWQNKRFLSGAIHWNTSNINAPNRDLIMAFGKIDPTATGANPFMTGVNYEYRQNGTDVTFADTYNGNITTPAGVFYGNANNQIESFMVNGVAPQGYNIETPAVRMTSNAAMATVNTTRPTDVYKGFAAGHMVKTVNGTTTTVNPMTTGDNLDNVVINVSDTNNQVGGEIKLRDKNAPSKTVNVTWGGATNANAYLSKDLYAGQQGSVTISETAGTATDTAKNGFVANASEISNVGACTSCEFVHWGVWAGNANANTTGGTNFDVAAAIPYVAGRVTEDLTANVSTPHNFGDVTYTGSMIGTEHNTTLNTLERVTGNFSSHIDLDTRQINSFTGNVGSFTGITMVGGGSTYVNASGPAAMTFNITGSSGANGVVNGALFGPQAQNIGGNYAITGGNATGAGVFLGSSPHYP